jgi:tetratricopeptide (TPR) repeat protein
MKTTITLFATITFLSSVTHAFSQEATKEENTINILQTALDKNPKSFNLLSELGRTFLINEKYQQAIEPLEKSIQLRKNDSKTHLHLALAYGAVGRHPEKLRELKETLRLSPNMAEANFKLAVAYAANKRHQEACQYYKKAIQLTPEYQEAHYFLSLSYFLTSRYKEALTSIKESIRLDPSNAEAHYTLGQIYIKLGKFNKAISPLQTAMHIQSDLPQIKLKSLGLSNSQKIK